MIPFCCDTYSRPSGPNCSDVGRSSPVVPPRIDLPKLIGTLVAPVPVSEICSGDPVPLCGMLSVALCVFELVGVYVTVMFRDCPAASVKGVDCPKFTEYCPVGAIVADAGLIVMLGPPAAAVFVSVTCCEVGCPITAVPKFS